MDNKLFKDYNPPDFSAIGNNLKIILLQYSEMLRPFNEIVAEVQKRIEYFTTSVVEAFRPFVAIGKLSEAQYVYWDFLTPDFEDTIIQTKNINKTLLEICAKDGFRKVNQTIQACKKHQLLSPNKRLFSQAVCTYRKKQYDLATVGLISVIDGLLADVSGNITHKFKVCINTIVDKLKADEAIDNDEVATVSLAWTFQKTMNSISAYRDFDGDEPKCLNRNWIMHGRSRRRKTQLDCVKLVNIIYGITLISEIVPQVSE